jgi:threonine/homoserine/homoserine lactone efflux protein
MSSGARRTCRTGERRLLAEHHAVTRPAAGAGAPVNGAIGQMLPAAVGVAISPLPIVAAVLLLITPRGRVNGLAYVLGWILGLGVVGTIVLLIAGGAGASSSGRAVGVRVLEAVLGVLLLLLAVRQWRGRPRGEEEVVTPKWMGALDRFGAAKSLAAGLLLSGLNPKNLLLAVGGAAAIAQAGIGAGQQAIGYAVFVVIATVGVAAPLVIAVALGDRSRQLLERIRGWLVLHNAAIMAVVLLMIGVKLIGDAIGG